MHKRLMKITTLAEYLDVSTGKVRQLVAEKRLPAPKFNEPKFVRWDRLEVDSFLGEVDNPITQDRLKMEERFSA